MPITEPASNCQHPEAWWRCKICGTTDEVQHWYITPPEGYVQTHCDECGMLRPGRLWYIPCGHCEGDG